MDKNITPTYMSINDAAKASGISARHIRNLARADKIKHIMLGNKYGINYPKMMEYFESQENTVS